MSENRNLPDWLDGFMLLTENSEPPLLFRKWTAVGTIAAALQRKVKVDIGISLTFYPNFYIVLVGPSATGKGTAMKYAYDIMEGIANIKLSAQATSLQALIRRMQETNLTDIDIATGKQVYHSSLTIFSNEFTVFLGYHNRELIAALCDWYDCHNRWVYDTISRSKEQVIGVWTNIVAGTTPENIQHSLPIEAIGAGLTSRIIFVNEEKKNKLVVFPSTTQREVELQQHLIHDLEQINLMCGTFNFTKDALSLYSDWCHDAEANPPFRDSKFDGYCGRRRNHLVSLSMVCSASRTSNLIIEREDLERSATMLAEVENKMGLTFKGMGRSGIAALINDSIAYLQNLPTNTVSIWEFMRHFEGDMDKFTMDKVLVTLEASKIIQRVRRPGADEMIVVLDDS